ncbi:uncharacterized protein LOC114273754 [Camellia sinensis]|uniref:uncharacterized protein LOC114273754 n=1 Tax=Camellia sinensis TaxID=4442 RepID=UPI00103617DB|nr:uncharacterized protein LOC114273754 [Camellia sinensis]
MKLCSHQSIKTLSLHYLLNRTPWNPKKCYYQMKKKRGTQQKKRSWRSRPSTRKLPTIPLLFQPSLLLSANLVAFFVNYLTVLNPLQLLRVGGDVEEVLPPVLDSSSDPPPLFDGTTSGTAILMTYFKDSSHRKNGLNSPIAVLRLL